VVTLSEAQALAQARRSTSRLLAWGVAVIIMSPCPLILLASLADDHAGPADDMTSLAGLVLTLLGIVVGVLLLLRRRQAFVGLGLEHLIDGRFTQSQEVSAWASRLRADNEGPRSRALMIAVGLFMLSPVPTVVAAVLGSRYDHSIYLAVGVCLTLAFVATGLLVLLPVSWASSTYETLTEEGQPTTTAGRSNALVGAVAAVYWPLVTAVFLVWGFLGTGTSAGSSGRSPACSSARSRPWSPSSPGAAAATTAVRGTGGSAGPARCARCGLTRAGLPGPRLPANGIQNTRVSGPHLRSKARRPG